MESIAETTTRANLAQWRALARPAPADFGLPCREVEEPAGRAQETADPWAAYCVMRAEEQARELWARCDTCDEVCLLEESVVNPYTDVLTCRDCLEAETLAGEEVLGGVLR